MSGITSIKGFAALYSNRCLLEKNIDSISVGLQTPVVNLIFGIRWSEKGVRDYSLMRNVIRDI